ncbi:sulfotransferase [Virgibacillus necropolis]|uniref:sulfotransferase n=1 Tax=Virgibacillus necropolis TaxID=163877 RepID=UPI00384F26CD
MENYPPMFIGGAERSGTTLLVDLLGLHSNISPVYETDFVKFLVKMFYTNNANIPFEDKKVQFKELV